MMKPGRVDRRLGTIDKPAATEAVAMTPASRIHNGIFRDSVLRISFLHLTGTGLDTN
jgi:hypothetical protein